MAIAARKRIITAVSGIENGAAGVAASESFIISAPDARGSISTFERTVRPEVPETADGRRSARAEISMTDIFFLTADESANTPQVKNAVEKSRSNMLDDRKSASVTPTYRTAPSFCTLSKITTDAPSACGSV